MIDARLKSTVTPAQAAADRSMRRLEYLLALLCFLATVALSAAR